VTRLTVEREDVVGCLGCGHGLDHCHGTLVEHLSGELECTDAGCVVLAAERHEHVVPCGQLAGSPCCP
jgi:hypothetical protein